MPTRNLTPDEIKAWKPFELPQDGLDPVTRARQRMEANNQWAPWQLIGRRMSIGCTALEITQRCNLDCSYCYLSESSEALKDIPLEEVFRRIDLIHAHYGDRADVQVTGGDPTLRKRDELVQIIRYIRSKNMQSSLFTNGIKATRDLLEELCEAGLEDIAFHVDLTQERKGYKTEMELNEVRLEYIERARGLPLSVFFNTTVYKDNFHEVPDLIKFFTQHHDVVRLAAFQVGADTGRGTERERIAISPATVQAQIEAGAGTKLEFGASSAGHQDCNRYAFGLVINGRVYDFFNDPAFVHQMLMETAHLRFDRRSKSRAVGALVDFLVKNPRLLFGFVGRLGKIGWQARRDLIASGFKVGKLSFHIHNFMDASALDEERCEACSFMVMTPEGPMSMCVHNAKRDDYLLVPAQVKKEQSIMFWNPATGEFQKEKPNNIAVELTRKNARGRAKDQVQGGKHQEANTETLAEEE